MPFLLAAPPIPATGISFASGWSGTGTFADGQPVTITKAAGGLGTGPSFLYEDFTTGTVGQRVTAVSSVFTEFNATYDGTGDFTFQSSGANRYAAKTRVGRYRNPQDETTGGPSIRGFVPTNVNRMFMTAWSKWQRTALLLDGTYEHNFFMENDKGHCLGGRAAAGGDFVHERPCTIPATQEVINAGRTASTHQYFSGQTGGSTGGGGFGYNIYATTNGTGGNPTHATIPFEDWIRLGVYFDLGTVDTYTGTLLYYINNCANDLAQDIGNTPNYVTGDGNLLLLKTGMEWSALRTFSLGAYLRFTSNNYGEWNATAGSNSTVTLEAAAPSANQYYRSSGYGGQTPTGTQHDLWVTIISGAGSVSSSYFVRDYTSRVVTIATDNVDGFPATWNAGNPNATSRVRFGGYGHVPQDRFWDEYYIGYGANAAQRLEITDDSSAWVANGGTFGGVANGPPWGQPTQCLSEIQHHLASWADGGMAFTIHKKGHPSLAGKHLRCVTGYKTSEIVGTFT